MSDVTGPISSLPGSAHPVPAGAVCDDHPARLATVRVQGETDSFGCEMHDLCAECAAEMRASIRDTRTGVCDWCKSEALDLRPRRDFEEGMCGPVYQVCGACVRRENEELAAETDFDDYWEDDYEPPEYPWGSFEWDWRDETDDPRARAWVQP